jgi:hypothetical protein
MIVNEKFQFRDLPVCSTVPQPLRHQQRAPEPEADLREIEEEKEDCFHSC